MTSAEKRPTASPGEPAPDFALPAIDGTGTISLADYRGRSPLFLALFVGLWCPFCRRAIAQIATTEPALKATGVETLCVVATSPENAQLYFRFRPTRLRMAADPGLTTHRAYGVPKPVPDPEFMQVLETVRINPEGMFPEPLPIAEAAQTVAKLDGYTENQTDHADMERQWPQLKGQFLIDRESIVRWANIEGGAEGAAGIGKFPSTGEILAAVQTMRVG
ncbi:redoxin domain-containing protein [Vineibacter terrae]|uniref:redoxin domain-containing protein n=1 Tax=Vineibacter terrae TaxID=2586908 RepID=UPI002E317762|nr:redoxin domain-containing protein [Vineibacter terrae]HEX2887633.1 redoxin domain-containing protein [Vineibacter terrae]